MKKEQELTGFMEEDKADTTISVELISTENLELIAISSLSNQWRIYYEAQMVMAILLELTEHILSWGVLSQQKR